MNHPAGPEADGADAYAVDSVQAEGESAADAAENETEPAEGVETGEPRVDAALRLLDQLPELPVTEHAAVFEQVHAELTAVLGQLDPESAGADD